jgi:hypothetical protein
MAMYHVAVRLSSPPLVKPVRPLYERYFRAEIIPKFRPLSLDQYLGGPIGIVTSAARFAYVLDNETMNWCIEWPPGLLVIDVTSDAMQWAARRSPNPQFGERSATDAEIERYEEWEEAWEREHYPVPQPQYGLIFDAWDDIVEQSFSEWQPGSKVQTQAIQKGFAHLDKLAEKLPKDTNDGAYVERLEEWRRSDFWNMRWEDFD